MGFMYRKRHGFYHENEVHEKDVLCLDQWHECDIIWGVRKDAVQSRAGSASWRKNEWALAGARGSWPPSDAQFSTVQCLSERLAELQGPREWPAEGASRGAKIMRWQEYVHDWLTHSNSYSLSSK